MSDDKTSSEKYGKLPPKEAEAEPWDKLCVDLIGPYKIERKAKKGSSVGAWSTDC